MAESGRFELHPRVVIRLVILAIALAGLGVPNARADEHRGVRFDPPTGWQRAESGEWLTFRHPGAPIMIVVGSAVPLGRGTRFEQWFDQALRREINPGERVAEQSETTATAVGEANLLMKSLVVDGQTRTFRVYCGVLQRGNVGLAMAITTEHTALAANERSVADFFGTLRIDDSGSTDAATKPKPVKPPTPEPPRGEELPSAEWTDSGPRGAWIGVSVLSGRPVYLTFLPDGRAYNGPLLGGLNRIDWAAVSRQHPTSVGAWTWRDGVLSIRWNDEQQTVWKSRVWARKSGIVFDGKNYWPARPVTRVELAGHWVSTAGTRGGGPITVVQEHHMTFDADGRVRTESITGGYGEAGGAVNSSKTTGRIQLDRLNATIRWDDGSTTAYSIWKIDTDDGIALGMDHVLYSRQR